MIDISALSLYNDDRNSKEVASMFFKADDKKIGEHLKELIKKRGYEKDVEFCKAYLNLQNKFNGYRDEELLNTKNRFSQIFKGKKPVQTYDLPILTNLLDVTCEEILSARKQYVPTLTHVTNYDIAQSDDRNIWEEYMKRDDRLFLNRDEYCKSVIDYALEFKNYPFMKYLLEEGFIWFVDISKQGYELYYYGADTIIKSNWDRFDLPDQYTAHELHEQDRLRTQTIVLAIENGDSSILDSLLARELPDMHKVNQFGTNNADFHIYRNEDLISAIAFSESDEILNYFSDEFIVKDMYKTDNTYMFPFLDEVIGLMLEYNKEKAAELILKKAISHNSSTYKKITKLIGKACEVEYGYVKENKMNIMKEAYRNGVSLEELQVKFKTEDDVKRDVICCFTYDDHNKVVAFFNGKEIGIATNIISVNRKNGSPTIKKLIEELNEWYNKVISLGGEKYAKILL